MDNYPYLLRPQNMQNVAMGAVRSLSYEQRIWTV